MGIAKAALIIMAGAAASRLLAVVRMQVIAALFGASSLTDAFTAASRVPLGIYDLLIGGMISAALVPVFSDYSKDEASGELWRLASTVMNFAGLVLTVVVGILILCAPQIIWVITPGYDQQTQDTAVNLLRFMLPALFFMGIGGILTGLHYSQQSFRIPALCVSLFNASVVAMALLFHEVLSVNSLVAGVLVGAFLQMAIQFLGMGRLRYSLTFDYSHPAARKILQLYLPVALGLVVSNLGIAIDTNLASFTGEGSLSAMYFATTLTQLPLGLVATAISMAALPSLSRSSTAYYQSRNDDRLEHLLKYKSTLTFGLRIAILAILPATVGLVILREPIVKLLFEYKAFDAHDTSQTALAFLAYSPGLPAAAIDQILIFAFYAMKNTMVPVLVGVAGVAVYLLVGLSLVGPWGMPGLAIANSAQLVFHASVMLLLLWRAIGGLTGYRLGDTLLKALAASGIMGLACYVAINYFSPQVDTAGLLNRILLVLSVSFLGILVYAACLLFMRVEETKLFWSSARARLGW